MAMTVIGLTQEEDADLAGNITYRYVVTLADPDIGFTSTVSVPAGPDWATAAIALAQQEAANVQAVITAPL